MKKILIALMVVIVSAVGGTYFYINHKVKQNLNDMIAAVQPFATITYKDVGNNLDGSIIIRDISISSPMGADADIDSVELVLPSLTDLMNMTDTIKSNQLIPSMQLKINHMRMDMDVIADMSRKTTANNNPIVNRLAALGCGDIQTLGDVRLSDLGYSEADVSLNIGYKYRERLQSIDITAQVTGHDMFAFSFDVEFTGINSYFSLASTDNLSQNLSFEYQDLGYNSKVAGFCGGKNGTTAAEYQEHHIDLVRQTLTAGKVELSDEIYAAYRDYLVNQAALRFEVNPTGSGGLDRLKMYQPKDWADIIGLEVFVNDRKIDDMRVNWDKDLTVDSLFSEQTSDEVEPVLAREENIESFTRTVAAPVIIETADLINHIGKRVEIETVNARNYKGTVESVTSDGIKLKIRMGTGTAEVPLLKRQMKKIVAY